MSLKKKDQDAIGYLLSEMYENDFDPHNTTVPDKWKNNKGFRDGPGYGEDHYSEREQHRQSQSDPVFLKQRLESNLHQAIEDLKNSDIAGVKGLLRSANSYVDAILKLQ